MPKSNLVAGSGFSEQVIPLLAAVAVGRAYLALNPVENDAGYLAGLFSLDRSWALIEEDIREDYRDGRVARVSGWPLSITEARILRAGIAAARPCRLLGGCPPTPADFDVPPLLQLVSRGARVSGQADCLSREFDSRGVS